MATTVPMEFYHYFSVNDTEENWSHLISTFNLTSWDKLNISQLLQYVLGHTQFPQDPDSIHPDQKKDYYPNSGGQEIKHAPVFNEMSMIKTVVLSVMFVISLLLNTATLIQMFRMRRRKSTINTLILHLTVADLIVTFFCFITDAVWASTVEWLAGNFMCKFIKFAQVFGLYLSTYIIVIISIDRCMAILDPMSRSQAPVRVRCMIITAWFCSGVFSLPQVRLATHTNCK